MGANVTLLTEAPNYSSLDIPQHLLNLARRVLDEALALKVTDRIALTARQRSILGKKPADKGKPSRSDCEIIETYIALGRALGKAAEPRLFVSSNKEDFFSARTPHDPHEDLFVDCTSANLRFVNNLSQAVSELFGRITLEPPAGS